MTLNGYDSAVTGPRGAGRSALCELVKKKHESLLRERLPGWTFVFLGSPLGALPLPPLCELLECEQYARARLLTDWGSMYHNVIQDFIPVYKRREEGERVLTLSDGLGCDALVDATAYSKSPEGYTKATQMHHMIVKMVFAVDGIKPPVYYVLMASPERVDCWMLQKYPNLANIPRQARLQFVRHQERVIRGYFKKGTGQTAIWLDAERYSLPELADQVFESQCERALAKAK